MDSDDSPLFDRLPFLQRQNAASRGLARIMANRAARRERWRAEALSRWEEWRHDPFFTLGVGLYWGEGDKTSTSHRLGLSNADVNLLRLWLRWCSRFLPAVPLKSTLSIHDDSNLADARTFWRRELGIEITWVVVAVSRASKRTRKTLPYGTLRISTGEGSLEWYTKMLVWLELARGL